MRLFWCIKTNFSLYQNKPLYQRHGEFSFPQSEILFDLEGEFLSHFFL